VHVPCKPHGSFGYYGGAGCVDAYALHTCHTCTLGTRLPYGLDRRQTRSQSNV
jgi:hypothetical protein